MYIYRNKEGLWHNINDNPSIIGISGIKYWFKNGCRHRTKGPAVIYPDGKELWYYKGYNITEKLNQIMKEGRLNPNWQNWTEEDEFLFVLLVS